MPNKRFLTLIALLTFSITAIAQANLEQIRNMQSPPKVYAAPKTATTITIDGKDNEEIWKRTPWSADFIDIEGIIKKKPLYNTRFKMTWDEHNLYIYARLEEPHIWGTLTKHDAIIYHDNDFEVFIKPRRHAANYYEIEINALNTIMDLMMNKPYRLGGEAIMHWDVKGLKSAIHVEGTLNNPQDKDQYWSIEMAIPFQSLGAFGQKPTPNINDYWQINFSRVQWQHEITAGKYSRKKSDHKILAEDNWVWSPIGLVNMHYPERWGYIQFTDNPESTPSLPKEYLIEKTAWNIYYLQKNQKAKKKKYAKELKKLEGYSAILSQDLSKFKYRILTNPDKTFFKATLIDSENKLKMTIDSFGNYSINHE